MDRQKIFVGRSNELRQFEEVMRDPRGQAIVVVGQPGMGKTWLVDKMADCAAKHPELKCGSVRYEVVKTDSVDSRLEIMMDDAFEAASNPGKFLGSDDRGKKQWLALLKGAEVIPVVGKATKAIIELAKSLRRDSGKDTRQQFINKMKLISRKMPDKGRAIFIIDPEKYMQADSDAAWAIVVDQLPEKIKLVFAQRPEDVLVNSDTFSVLGNVKYIPEDRLDILDEAAVDKLLDLRGNSLKYTVTKVRKALLRYDGHPFAIQAALDLLESELPLEKLPTEPKPVEFAKRQRERAFDKNPCAVQMLEAYAVLDVAVPDDVVQVVSKLDSPTITSLMNDKYISSLLRDEGNGKRIYHAILNDYIAEEITDDEKKQYHGRAIAVYRDKIKTTEEKQTKPDGLAATRLAEHVLAAEGQEAFVKVFVNECSQALNTLGLLDALISLSKQALKVVKRGSDYHAMLLGNLGLIYRKRGDLDTAQQMHLESLEIAKKLGLLRGMARQYGNLGIIYWTRGDLDRAEQMFRDGLKIDEKLGRLEGMASKYGNLGVIYMDRGDLAKAEQMILKSLEINKKLGLLEGMAKQYGNLGAIYGERGDPDKAEQMFRDGLKIEERLGRLEGMATKYGNLGSICMKRGDLDKAREYWLKARELFKKIGMPHMVEKMQGWLESLEQ